ncbi:MAG: PilN domain-containing protein [bacterium]
MIETDLLRQKTQKRRPRAQKARKKGGGGFNIIPIILALIFAVILIPLTFIFQQIRINSVKNRIEEIETDINRMQQELESRREAQQTLLNLQEQERQLRERIAIIASLNSGRAAYAHMLQEIADNLPEYTWISSLSESGGKITITGMTLYDIVLPHLWDKLSNSPYLTNIMIENWALTSIGEQPAVSFTLTANLVKTTLHREEVENE